MESRLQDLCAMKLVIDFCMQPDVKKIILEEAIDEAVDILDLYESKPICHLLYCSLKEKFSNSLKKLPDLVRKNVPCYLIPFIGAEMRKWVCFHYKKFGLGRSYCITFMRSSLFNGKGIINKELTAIELVKDESLPIPLRFDIAYHYLLLEYIRKFWFWFTKQDKCRSRYYGLNMNIDPHPHHNINTFFAHIKSFWNVHKLKSVSELIEKDESEVSIHLLLGACVHSFCSRNEISFKNYFVKLDKSSKEFALKFLGRVLCFKLNIVTIDPHLYTNFYPTEPFVNMAEYLFCELSNEELQSLSQPHLYYGLLMIFLLWPYQYLFMKVANLFWQEISNFEFYILLHLIINKLDDQHFSNTYDYRSLFVNIWKMASPNYKKYVFSIESGETLPNPYLNAPEYRIHENKMVNKNCFLLTKIFQLRNFNVDDQYIIKFLMTDASDDVKEKIVVQQGMKFSRSIKF